MANARARASSPQESVLMHDAETNLKAAMSRFYPGNDPADVFNSPEYSRACACLLNLAKTRWFFGLVCGAYSNDRATFYLLTVSANPPRFRWGKPRIETQFVSTARGAGDDHGMWVIPMSIQT